jgi:hypothetical protein
MNDYWMKTENLSALTPYVSKGHCGKNLYGAVRLTLNLGFGRRTEPTVPAQEPYMPDMDSGIVNGLK